MENKQASITVTVRVNAPVAHCWKVWTTASDIMQWNGPSVDWHTPRAEIDLRVGGRLFFRMETKDGSMGFDHAGTYDTVVVNELLEYTGDDGRKSVVVFTTEGRDAVITETFEPGEEPSSEVQRDFVQGVLNNFKQRAEHTK